MRIPVIGVTGLSGDAVRPDWIAGTLQAMQRDPDGRVMAPIITHPRRPVR